MKKTCLFREYRGWHTTHVYTDYNKPLLVGGWTTHLKNMLVKLDHFPNFRDDNKNILVATTQIIRIPIKFNPFWITKFHQIPPGLGMENTTKAPMPEGLSVFGCFTVSKKKHSSIVGSWATHLKKYLVQLDHFRKKVMRIFKKVETTTQSWHLNLPKPTVGPHKTSRSPRRTTLRHLTAGNVRGLGTHGTVGSAKLSAQHFKLSLAQGECVQVLFAAINMCVCVCLF